MLAEHSAPGVDEDRVGNLWTHVIDDPAVDDRRLGEARRALHVKLDIRVVREPEAIATRVQEVTAIDARDDMSRHGEVTERRLTEAERVSVGEHDVAGFDLGASREPSEDGGAMPGGH